MSKLPKGYRVTVAPAKVVGGGTGFYEPRVWFNGTLLWLNPGAVFEDKTKAREYGKDLARTHAQSKVS